MKILLVNPPVRTWAKPNCFPVGLGMIAQVLRKDHDLHVLDLNIIRPDTSKLHWITNYAPPDVDAVGITAMATQYKFVKEFSASCKWFYPGRPIVLGGALASSAPELVLKYTDIDICVMGEGELTAVDLFRRIEKQQLDNHISKKHIITPQKPITDISALPHPAYDLFPTEIYAQNPVGSTINTEKWIHKKTNTIIEVPKAKSMNLYPTRSCPYSCLFCAHDFYGYSYRFQKAERIIEEMVELSDTYGIRFFLMGSDCFVVNKENVKDFSKQLSHPQYRDIQRWEASARVDTVTCDLMRAMHSGGCEMVCFGVESGNQTVLNWLKKGYSIGRAKKSIKQARSIFGSVDTTFIIGTPVDTSQTIQDTIDFCNECEINPQAIFYLTPYPGTPLWQYMLEENPTMRSDAEQEFLLERLSNNEQGEDIAYNFSRWPDEELKQIKREMSEKTGAWNG